MRIDLYGSAEAFLDAVAAALVEREPENNIVLSSARLLVDGDHPFAAPYFLASVSDDAGRVVGAALRTPPDSLFLTAMPEGAAGRLVEHVANVHPSLPSVSGPLGPAHEFAQSWCRVHAAQASVRHHWKLYVLERAVPPARVARGWLRRAEASDFERLREWGARFAAEVNAPADVTGFLERMFRRRSLYVWDDRGACCLVAISGRTPNGVRVAAVYTPEEHRNRGYATSAVYEITSAMLESGFGFCMLIAETKDEVPNRMYRRLGFEYVEERVMLELTSAPSP